MQRLKLLAVVVGLGLVGGGAVAVAAPAAKPAPAGKVTKAVMVVNHKTAANSYKGKCPAHVEFEATVWVSGPTTVKYHWERSDGVKTDEKEYTFQAAGSAGLPVETWDLGAAGQKLHAWEKLAITSPSPRGATGRISITCDK